MLKNSRVTGALDTARLGQALARPGMDTRTWVSLAFVTKITIDADEGVFVDVVLMPGRQQATARLGTEYAGNGFGIYAPLEVDDEVLIEAPNGDADQGLIITRRLHSASDPPPSEAVDFPEDFLLVARADKTVRILVEGEGQVEIRSRDGAAHRVAFFDELDSFRTWVRSQFAVTGGHTHAVVGAATTTTATVAGSPLSVPPTADPPTVAGTEYLRAE